MKKEIITIQGHEIPDNATVLVLFDDYPAAKKEYETVVNGIANHTHLNEIYTAVLYDQRFDIPDRGIKILFRERDRSRIAGFHKRKTVVFNKGRFPQWLREFQNLKTWF